MDYTFYKLGTLVDSIYEWIKKDIADSYLKSGERLNVRLLSERYHVSETPIKQALNRLIMEGLVVSIPRKGMRVRQITREEIDEILEIRLMMDTFFISKIIANIQAEPELASQLQDIIRQQVACLKHLGEPSRYNEAYDLDYQFHERYISACGSRKALELFHTLNSHVYSSFIYGKQPMEDTLEGIREHQMLLTTLTAGDQEQAYKWVVQHCENARKHIFSALESRELDN